MRSAARTKKRVKHNGREIFSDTPLLKNREDIILKGLTGVDRPKKPIAFYLRRAEGALQKMGFEYNQASFDRSTEDCTLPSEIHEAWRLISLHHTLGAITELRLTIMREATEAAGPVDGSQNVLRLIEDEKAMAMEIGALGERIKGHESDAAAAKAKKNTLDARKGHEAAHGTPEQKSARWKRFQEAVDQALALETGISHWEVSERVALSFHVHPRTIFRHTKLPPHS